MKGVTMRIIKRNGEEVNFDSNKIYNAILHANKDVKPVDEIDEKSAKLITERVVHSIIELKRTLTVEEIQDIVENELFNHGYINLGKEYTKYRYKRALIRKANSTDDRILSLIDCKNEDVLEENSNKNPVIVSVQRDYMAGEVSKDLTRRILLPTDVVKAHDEGIIHFHDADYFAQHMYNCCLINIKDMLKNGTVISGILIEEPQSFVTTCTIVTQIIAQVASCQYGGQSISIAHLAPYVAKDRAKFIKQVDEEFEGFEDTEELRARKKAIVEKRVKREIEKGVQTMNYQVVTLQTTNGQAPFITFFMYLNEVSDPQVKADLAMIIEEIIKQRYKGMKNEQGVYITVAFPKLIYVLEEDNIHEDSKYWYLTKLAAKCSIKRLVPDYISEKQMKAYKEGNCFPPMGCRSMLSPWKDENGEYKFYGRFNMGVVTLNLPNIALASGKDMNKFWEIFAERMELVHTALKCRYRRLLGTSSSVAPILWNYGAIARLPKGAKIDSLLHDGYSTISVGYAGICETVRYMTGESNTSPAGKKLALDIMEFMNKFTEKWKEEEHIGYSIYGTPLESTTYKFAKANQKMYGIIEGVTSEPYVTNSYHVHVKEKISAFDKLAYEAEFQPLSIGGCISYIELPNMENNVEAVLEIMKFMYDHIIYSEFNVKSDQCLVCNTENVEMKIIEDTDGKLVWECPVCGNRDQSKMTVARRTCGYIGSQFWNQGRTAEIRDRVLHVD